MMHRNMSVVTNKCYYIVKLNKSQLYNNNVYISSFSKISSIPRKIIKIKPVMF